MALSNLGLIGMAGAMLTPGGGLGQGFSAYGHGAMQDSQMQATNAYRQAQIQQIQAVEEERRMKIEQARQLQQNDEALNQLLLKRRKVSATPQPGAMASAPQGMGGDLGSGTFGLSPDPALKSLMMQPPQPQQLQQSQQSQALPMDQELYMAMIRKGMTPQQIEGFANANQMGLPEVARTIEGVDDLGNKQTGQYSKQGQLIGKPIRAPTELELKNFGNHYQGYNKNTGALVGNKFDISQSPDSVASNKLGWYNAATARDKMQYERDNPSLATVETADGIFQVPNRGGAGRQVLGTDNKPLAGKPPTEAQSNTALFANRMIKADAKLSELAAKGVSLPGQIKQGAEGIPLIGGGVGAALNAAPTWMGGPSAEQQQVEQAQRDFLNAVLRKESGAVIGPSEFASGKLQYFPQLGDSDAVIEQKAQARQSAIIGMSQGAGTALKRVQDAQGKATAPDTNTRKSGSISMPTPDDIAAELARRGIK